MSATSDRPVRSIRQAQQQHQRPAQVSERETWRQAPIVADQQIRHMPSIAAVSVRGTTGDPANRPSVRPASEPGH